MLSSQEELTNASGFKKLIIAPQMIPGVFLFFLCVCVFQEAIFIFLHLLPVAVCDL